MLKSLTPRICVSQGGAIMAEFDVVVECQRAVVLKVHFVPIGIKQKILYFLGLIKPGDVAAEFQTGTPGRAGRISYIDMSKKHLPTYSIAEGYGFVYPTQGVLRVAIGEDTWYARWNIDFDLVPMNN